MINLTEYDFIDRCESYGLNNPDIRQFEIVHMGIRYIYTKADPCIECFGECEKCPQPESIDELEVTEHDTLCQGTYFRGYNDNFDLVHSIHLGENIDD